MIKTGQVLNNTYKITEQLGSGGGGIVFKAYHLRLEKYVAVKLIKDKIKGHINERAEADILKRLKHEGLPQVYDFVNDGDDVYTVMEFIDGSSLFDVVSERKRIPYKQALQWARELCAAAAYLHTRKPPIVHSDIKPQNIMITDENKVCLIDFNISSVFDGGYYTVGSSDGYSPPEQYIRTVMKNNSVNAADSGDTEILSDDRTELLFDADNDKTELLEESASPQPVRKKTLPSGMIDERSDVYSIGAVMYNMVTGVKPNNSRKQIVPLKKLDENIPDAYVYIVEKAMAPDKPQRFSSAAEMLEALNKINRLDRRYKAMTVRHTLAYVLCLLLLTGSLCSVIAGKRLMTSENEDRLYGYISAMSEYAESNDIRSLDELVGTVLSEYPECAEARYYGALCLYREKRFDECSAYISENVVPIMSGLSEEMRSDSCFMAADIAFRNENYEEAARYYASSVISNPANADIYRDYALSLARSGDTQGAENIMSSAAAHGLSDDGIFMLTGEIQFTRKEYAAAINSLGKTIDMTDDDNMKRSAYLVCAKSYRELYADDPSLIEEDIAMLERAVLELPQEMTLQIREYLVQAYIDYGEKTSRTEYFVNAVQELSKLKALGWSDYRTEMNIAVLVDRIGDTQGAENLLLEMAETSEYEPHYFEIYTRLAYCEADIQSKKENSERDYSRFDGFFGKAEEAYKIYSENGNSDPEMDKLRQLRAELTELGWLDEPA